MIFDFSIAARRGAPTFAAFVCLAGPLAAGAPSTLAAQQASAAEPSEPPTLEAARRTSPVEIDGRIAEEAWASAPVASDFVQGEPEEGVEPARRTEVRILYDDEALYVAARMHERDASAIADQLVRRDEQGQYDHFEVQIDPNLDRQTGYLFRVGASGVERDAFLYDDVREDENWDAVWSSAVRRDSAGWSVEMRIPLSQIRYESQEGAQTWGLNLVRRRLASTSVDYFALRSRTEQGRVSQFGRLTGLRLAAAERRFEVTPYLATSLATGPSDPDDPFFDGSELDPRAGVNVQYGIGSAFSLDATINPDFGQVEVDPAVVNLTAFETFFSEKRPFFVQDARVFDFDLSGRQSRLFFSRRIGREPQGDVPDGAEFVDVPSRTTILGASKFTGRTQEGLSVGVLGAVTQEEVGRASFGEESEPGSFVAEPASQYGVARVQQDFRDGATRVGAIVTGVNRSLPEDGALDFLPTSAVSGGIDFEHQWGGTRNRRWSLSGYVAGTHVRGSREAMIEIQTNPQHYYQRPDADDLSVDSTTTHLTGVNWAIEFGRQSGEHWTWNVGVEQLSPDFSANDLGFSNQGEQVDLEGFAQYQEIEPGSLFRSWELTLFTFHEWRNALLDDLTSADGWAGAYKGGQFSLNGEAELHNNWELDMGLEYGPRSLSDTETRGGPLMTDPASAEAEFRLNTDPRRMVSLGPSISYEDRYSGGGSELGLGLDVTLRPTPSFELSLEPQISFEDDASQFVTSTDTVPFERTFGARYLFADLERTELSMETRLEVAFSPDLSLQLFAQPLLSSGDFLTYKQLARPSSFEFEVFDEGMPTTAGGGPGCSGGATCTDGGERFFDFDGDGRADLTLPTQDFNFRSLRGNAVFRWEYRPGSTLFLVWQQNRSDEAPVGDFDFGRDLEGLFSADTENTFIVKVSHFLDL